MRRKLRFLAVLSVVALVVASCGGDDDSSGSDDPAPATPSEDAVSSGSSDDSGSSGQSSSGGGATGGILVIGDETIELDSARCYLQEQDVAGSPGKILWTAQGFGTNAEGQEVLVDVSRFDEDSDFTGDDVLVDIGEIGNTVTYNASAEIGAVTLDGRTLTAPTLSFTNWDDFAAGEQAGSLVINC